jgi:hypothetical protein
LWCLAAGWCDLLQQMWHETIIGESFFLPPFFASTNSSFFQSM